MAEQHIYPPPPSANHEEDHPYGNQQRMRSTEHSQIPPPAAANMQGDPNDMQGFGQANLNGQVYGQPHPPTPQQLAQRGLAVGPNHNGLTQDSPSSRSKASRACDECRRKKVCLTKFPESCKATHHLPDLTLLTFADQM